MKKENPFPKVPKSTPSRLFIATTALTMVFGGLSHADDGDTFGSATAISPGTRNASLTSGDEDWFKFTLNSPGLVALYTQGLTDTYLNMYDSVGNYLYIANDNSGASYNFSRVQRFDAGTYYFRVKSGTYGAPTGNYSLTLRTQESAPLITASNFNGSLTAGEIDFVRVPLEKKGLFEIYTTGNTDTHAYLYDSVGVYQYISNDNSGSNYNFHIARSNFAAGTYLVTIQGGTYGSGTGSYQGFILRPTQARKIGAGSLVHNIDPLGDVDHFEFDVPKRSEVRLWTTGTTDTDGEIYDANGVYTYIANNNSGTGYNFSISRTLEAGTYYLRVSAGTYGNPSGPFRLHLSFPGDPGDPGLPGVRPRDATPSIWISSPRPGARIGRRLTLRGGAADDKRVAAVECGWRGRWTSASFNGSSWSRTIRPGRGKKRKVTVLMRVIDSAGQSATTSRTFKRKRR